MKSILLLATIFATSVFLATGCATKSGSASAGCDGSCCKDPTACAKCCGTNCASCCMKK